MQAGDGSFFYPDGCGVGSSSPRLSFLRGLAPRASRPRDLWSAAKLKRRITTRRSRDTSECRASERTLVARSLSLVAGQAPRLWDAPETIPSLVKHWRTSRWCRRREFGSRRPQAGKIQFDALGKHGRGREHSRGGMPSVPSRASICHCGMRHARSAKRRSRALLSISWWPLLAWLTTWHSDFVVCARTKPRAAFERR